LGCRWIPEYERFWRIFVPDENINIFTTVPGNHDLGLGDGISTSKLERYKHYFTNGTYTSQLFQTCNFQLLMLDTPSLLNTQIPEISSSANEFLDFVSGFRLGRNQARLLFTHIPLYRPPETDCGKQRESKYKSIRVGGGYQYQNVLEEDLTTRIFDSLWPVSGVFSGDDHDSCVVDHQLEGRREEIPEYTVKSFSWAMVPIPSSISPHPCKSSSN